jgi:hypothetical protein
VGTLSSGLAERLKMEDNSKELHIDINRRLSDYAMALDLLGAMTGINTEPEVIKKILEFFSMLCSPSTIVYLPVVNGKPDKIFPLSSHTADSTALMKRLANVKESYAWTESGSGFILKIADSTETMGIIEIDGISFPEYKKHYLNLCLNIMSVLTIAISNARNYQKLELTKEMLREERDRAQEALDKVKLLSGLLPTCASCKKIKDDKGEWQPIEFYISQHSEAAFTHGLCPECALKLYPDLYKEILKKKGRQ